MTRGMYLQGFFCVFNQAAKSSHRIKHKLHCAVVQRNNLLEFYKCFCFHWCIRPQNNVNTNSCIFLCRVLIKTLFSPACRFMAKTMYCGRNPQLYFKHSVPELRLQTTQNGSLCLCLETQMLVMVNYVFCQGWWEMQSHMHTETIFLTSMNAFAFIVVYNNRLVRT